MPSNTGKFPRSEIVRGKCDFALFSKAKHVGHGFLRAAFLRHSDRKVAFAVGKKVSRLAVERNRLKRRLRELYRINREHLPENIWLMIIARPEAKNADFRQLEADFLEICHLVCAKVGGGIDD